MEKDLTRSVVSATMPFDGIVRVGRRDVSFGKVFGGILILFGLYTWYLEVNGPKPGTLEAQNYEGISEIALAIIEALPVAFLPGLLAILIGAALIYKT